MLRERPSFSALLGEPGCDTWNLKLKDGKLKLGHRSKEAKLIKLNRAHTCLVIKTWEDTSPKLNLGRVDLVSVRRRCAMRQEQRHERIRCGEASYVRSTFQSSYRMSTTNKFCNMRRIAMQAVAKSRAKACAKCPIVFCAWRSASQAYNRQILGRTEKPDGIS